jgi:DNA repair exonuclease SbcCD ATPase subunit
MKILDTRDLYKRQQELQADLDALQEAVTEADETLDAYKYDSIDTLPEEQGDAFDRMEEYQEALATAEQDLKEWQDEYQEELDELNALVQEVSEWRYGTELIPEDDFTEYAQDLAEDCYNLPDHWPFTCIDWGRAAEELKQDYSTVDYQGTTYLFRS